jgi:hypothetical protein
MVWPTLTMVDAESVLVRVTMIWPLEMEKSAWADSAPSEPEPLTVKVEACAEPIALADAKAIQARELRTLIFWSMEAVLSDQLKSGPKRRVVRCPKDNLRSYRRGDRTFNAG